MTYRYRVTLAGIKGFFRLYEVNAESSLYSFHKRMRSDMEFPADQLILFKGMDEVSNVVARYGLFDIGNGACDQVSMGQTVAAGIVSFVYFYDVTNKKSVIVTLEGESGHEVAHPVLVEGKGPDPIEFENGYVAFEDLPAEKRRLPSEDAKGILGMNPDDIDYDDDEDDDEGDDGGDEGEEIIDEEDVAKLQAQ